MKRVDVIAIRIDIFKQMQNFVDKYVDDEDILDYWFENGIPDGANDEMLAEFAELEDCYVQIFSAFRMVCRKLGVI